MQISPYRKQMAPGASFFGVEKIFFQKSVADSQIMSIFASAFGNETTWCGSSVWLECRPVTPEVASSSLVRTARKDLKPFGFRSFLCL